MILNTSRILFLVANLIYLFSSNFATEVGLEDIRSELFKGEELIATLSQKGNTRNYLSLSKSNNSFKVLEFEQEKGDFPYLVSSLHLDSSDELKKFISQSTFVSIEKSEDFDQWPLEPGVDFPVVEKRGGQIVPKRNNLFGLRQANQVLWPVRNQWSEDWERKYSQWIMDNVQEDFFSKYNISTDCADAIVGIRWIFSRIHGLPVANHIATSSNLFTNYSVPKKWRYLATGNTWNTDQLFMTALNYIMGVASTRTIKLDGYAVSLDKKGLSVGAFLLTESQDSNHVKIISENHFDDITSLPLFTLASTVPRKVRLLVREVVLDQGWPERNVKSFLKFRWPIVTRNGVYLKAKDEHSDFSVEQFSSLLREQNPIFVKFLLNRLKSTYEPSSLINLSLQDIVDYTKQRVSVVNEGFEFCQRNDCSLGTANWDAWSTPSRDKKLLQKFKNMDVLTKEFEDLAPGLQERWRKALNENFVRVTDVSLSLASIRQFLDNGLASSEPNDSINKRWGIDLEGNAGQIVAQIKELLIERKERIASQWEECLPKDCIAKSSKWLSWNTFNIDENLKTLYSKLIKVCEVYGTDSCFELIFNKDDIISINDHEYSLVEIARRIPLFYSDLNVSVARRWGNIPSDYSSFTLERASKISFSKKDYFLVDNNILDANDGETLYEATGSIALNSNGYFAEFNKETQSLKIFNSNLEEEVSIGFNIPIESSYELEEFIGQNDWYFQFSDGETSKWFSRENSGSIGLEAQINLSKDNSLLFDIEKRTIFSLRDNRILDISKALEKLSSEMQIGNLSPYKILNGDTIVLNYQDENQGVSYPIVLINGVPKVFQQTPYISTLIKGSHDNDESQLLFLEDRPNDEYPNALILNLKYQEIEQIGNQFTQVTNLSGETYFGVLSGSAWDNNRLPKFYKMDGTRSAPLTAKSFLHDLNTEGLISHFNTFGVFLNGKDVFSSGYFLALTGNFAGQSYNVPSFLRMEREYCANTWANPNALIEQFNYHHGDYRCLGTVYDDSKKPIFTFGNRDKAEVKVLNLEASKSLFIESLGNGVFQIWSKNYSSLHND